MSRQNFTVGLKPLHVDRLPAIVARAHRTNTLSDFAARGY